MARGRAVSTEQYTIKHDKDQSAKGPKKEGKWLRNRHDGECGMSVARS